MTAAKSLHVLEEAARYGSDHNPLFLHVACDTVQLAHSSNPSAACEARVRYDVHRAEAYQEALASLLQQHFILFIQHELDVDLLATKLVACMISAAKSTMPQVCKRSGVCSRKQQAWFDSRCKEALAQKEAVYNNRHSTATQKLIAEKTFRSVTDRVKEAWSHQRNVELCEMAAKDANRFWRLFKAPHSSARPVELSAQFAAFRDLMGAEPLPAPTRPATSGVSTPNSDDALNKDITIDELCSCIKQLKRGKSPGIDGILPDMIKDGGELVKQSLLWLFNCMLAGHFPERLSVGLITAVYKSGDKSDMSNYRGITVGSVIAKLFAMILEQRIAS